MKDTNLVLGRSHFHRNIFCALAYFLAPDAFASVWLILLALGFAMGTLVRA